MAQLTQCFAHCSRLRLRECSACLSELLFELSASLRIVRTHNPCHVPATSPSRRVPSRRVPSRRVASRRVSSKRFSRADYRAIQLRATLAAEFQCAPRVTSNEYLREAPSGRESKGTVFEKCSNGRTQEKAPNSRMHNSAHPEVNLIRVNLTNARDIYYYFLYFD